MALLSLKSIKHRVKLAEAATETKKRAKIARYAIPLGRGMRGHSVGVVKGRKVVRVAPPPV